MTFARGEVACSYSDSDQYRPELKYHGRGRLPDDVDPRVAKLANDGAVAGAMDQ